MRKIINLIFMVTKLKLAVTSVIVVLAVVAGSVLAYQYNLSQNVQGNIFDNLYYEGYKSFFSWVKGDVTRYRLPTPLLNKLSTYYPGSLGDTAEPVAYAYSKVLGSNKKGYAMTDCYKMYFPDEKMTKSIASAKDDAGVKKFLSKDNKSYVKWLLHELAHTEQCHDLSKNGSYEGKRKAFANLWVNQVGLKLFKDPSKNIDKIHDSMPMETAAEAKANDVMGKLGL